MTTPHTPQTQDDLRAIVGEIPNYIFEYLELSDGIKKEWKHGSKASDFGGHNQFVQKFTKRIESYISTHYVKKSEVEKLVREARIDENNACQNIIRSRWGTNDQLWEMQSRLTSLQAPTQDHITRLEVIDETGRTYVKGAMYGSPVTVELSYQDDGKTLKIFVKETT